jgi:hypothetical protein
MNKTKKIVLGLGAVALVIGISGAMTNSASAYRGDPTVQGPNYTAERHTLMQKAFETNDYTAWKTLMTNKSRVTQVINQDNFAKFAQAHSLAMKGDLAGAKEIRQGLGLGLKNGSGVGMKNNQNKGMNKDRGLNQ